MPSGSVVVVICRVVVSGPGPGPGLGRSFPHATRSDAQIPTTNRLATTVRAMACLLNQLSTETGGNTRLLTICLYIPYFMKKCKRGSFSYVFKPFKDKNRGRLWRPLDCVPYLLAATGGPSTPKSNNFPLPPRSRFPAA